MTVNFDEKHLTFWILGNAFYGTPGILYPLFWGRFGPFLHFIQFRHLSIFGIFR